MNNLYSLAKIIFKEKNTYLYQKNKINKNTEETLVYLQTLFYEEKIFICNKKKIFNWENSLEVVEMHFITLFIFNLESLGKY